ncbi:aminopeptidase N [Pseudoalteromonas phenolica]|uniref:Aminopeptidase N n=1 Tax=Pseudoalteromonas phenolica TaxID=161398 RepID=A0A0S2K2J6_9GAMM|nr:aminopeptidase N [Pseudoalteromonas phenolica]ALO42287.1 Aminopeptidase N [Pseudoalteromonas phenolica]MBE0356619.1 aminopeptidase N [Pseudoalteromonas phenolica O-BC30]RXE96947.1 aminopeptidase N [Pseudoalteromonas phenolica O-BC30]
MQSQPQAKYLKDYQAPSHTVTNLELTVELDPTDTKVVSKALYSAAQSVSELCLDGVELNLISVKVNGQLFKDFVQTETSLTLKNLPNEFTLEIENTISPSTNTSLEGLYLSEGAYCTQCEAEGFRKITYFLDRPDVLTDYLVTIIADKDIPYLLSNGNKIEEGNWPDGRRFTKWQDPHKKPSYLFALVAGDFDVLRDTFVTRSGREVALEIFVDKGNLDKTPHAMASLKNAMKWDEERFDLEYDLDIYMIVAVDFFNMGAMENKGLNVFNSACVLANQQTATDRDYHTIESIVGHEYFHNWTGNRVTCRDWFQLSLKEGLTVFRDQEFSSDLGSRALNRIDAVMAMKTHQFAEDSGPMAHPIRPEKVIEMNNFYTVTVYNKGAEVIRMMHTLLGEANFQKGMKLYFERHDGQAVTCDDFVAAMGDASGKCLEQFKLWYRQFGTPTVQVETSYNVEQQTFTLKLNQIHAENDPVSEPLHIPFAIELLDTAGNTIPLISNGKDFDAVIELKEISAEFTFENILSKPTPVLLENFSAPCVVSYDYESEELIHILRHASSDFTRWEAAQRAFTMEIQHAVNTLSGSNPVSISDTLIKALKSIIAEENTDKALISELIKLPNFDTVSAEFSPVPVTELVDIYKQFELQIATQLQSELTAVYKSCLESGEISASAVAARSLKATALYYLALLENDEVTDWLLANSQQDNMTLKLAALKAVKNADHEVSEQLISQFDAQWRHDPLVMDKWFALQATTDNDSAIDLIKSLYDHPCFDKSNPNRVRALVGQFARSNPAQFHRIDGKGYELLADLLIELNAINPQNASRMVTPFMSWKRYDPTRQQLIKSQLERIASVDNLSDDLYEKVDKALNV